MLQIIILFHLVIAVSLVALVLVQQGKGAGMGASFGSGSANTVFGSAGPASFLMKLTGSLAALFFITSLTLGYMASANMHRGSGLVPPPVQNSGIPVK